MDAIPLRRDLVVEMKRETIKNVKILSIVQSIPKYIARLVLEDNVLEKPTQSIFNQLAYFLVRIIDHKVSTALPWPIYDSLTERKFRNELGIFISHYSNKGLLDSVKTSYLVNPGFYKVTWLIYQMSQLAVQKVLESKMHKKNQIDRYKDMTSRYKSKDNNFMEEVKNETEIILSKFSNYLHKRKSMEIIAEKMRSKITDMETKISCGDAQKFLDNIVDVFVGKHNLSEEVKSDILKIKNVFVPAPFFDRWLSQVDQQLDQMESKWDEKMNPFIQTCQETMLYTETLVARHVGDADKDSYMVQYNHDTDEINTTELQNQVNSQQKYILRNLTMDRTLNFPNLIRAYIIAIGHIMKGESVGDDIYKFNEYLSGGQQNFREVVLRLRDVMNRVMVAEAKLQISSEGYAIVEDLLSPAECDELVEAAYKLAESFEEKHKQVFSTEKECQLETDYLIHSNDQVMPFYESKALDEDGNLLVNSRYSLNKIAHALHYIHPLFRCYTYCDRIKTLAKRLRLLEPAVVQSMVIFKNPGVSSEVQPHQDSTYLYTEPKTIFGFWIALEDATVDNGCLHIAAGSHKTGTHRRLIRNPDPTATTKLIYDKPAPIYPTSSFKPVPIKKGSCIILHGDVVHKSGINKTDKPRPAYTFHVVEKKNNNYSPDNWLQEGPAAPFENLYTVEQIIYSTDSENPEPEGEHGPSISESRPSPTESGQSSE